MPEDPHADEPLLEIPDGRAAYCGACAYDVRGLTIERCPECGERLRRVGVLAERPKAGSALLRAVLFLIVFIPTAIILRLVVLAPLPNVYTEEVSGAAARLLDAQTSVVVSVERDEEQLVWPLGDEESDDGATWELAIATMPLPGYGTIDPSDVASAAAGATTMTIRGGEEAQSTAELAAALGKAGVPEGETQTWAKTLLAALPAIATRDVHSGASVSKRSWLPGGWRSSSSGGASLSPVTSGWDTARSSYATTLSKHPLAEAAVTLFFVLLGLAGLGIVIADLDLRPGWLGGRRPKA